MDWQIEGDCGRHAMVRRVDIAVVIPALDEADVVENAVASASCDAAEVWVVDGGSCDATRRRAHSAGARVIESARGRAQQLQAGFRASQGDVIVFLHADTCLPAGWEGAIRGALEDPGVAGGAFRLRFDDRSPRMRIIEIAARFRTRLLALPFGDQALFIRRNVLEQAGGIADVPLMEDLDLVAAMKSRGRLALLRLSATTSGRRYRERGFGRTSVLHFIALGGWFLNVDRNRLARWLDR